MSNNVYGIDLGTNNFKVYSKATGKTMLEKNTIAVIDKKPGIYSRMAVHINNNTQYLVRRRTNHTGIKIQGLFWQPLQVLFQ